MIEMIRWDDNVIILILLRARNMTRTGKDNMVVHSLDLI
jgi:hypothetical protein